MSICLFETVLARPCGRQASQPLTWVEIRPAWDHRAETVNHSEVFCPFHYDLTLTLLVLDCTVHEITTSKAVPA